MLLRIKSRSVELNPHDADAFAVLARLCVYQGNGEEAKRAMTTAWMLNPFPSAWYRWLHG